MKLSDFFEGDFLDDIEGKRRRIKNNEKTRLNHRVYVFHKDRNGKTVKTEYDPGGDPRFAHKSVKDFMGWVLQNSKSELGEKTGSTQSDIDGETKVIAFHHEKGVVFLSPRELNPKEQQNLVQS